MHLQCFLPTRYMMGGTTRTHKVTTFTRFSQNESLLASYGSTMHSSSSMRFLRTNFFPLSVLKIKIKKAARLHHFSAEKA
jgi:hypothetical protein